MQFATDILSVAYSVTLPLAKEYEMSYFDLVQSMYNRAEIEVVGLAISQTGGLEKRYGIVNRIEAEDGSGRHFNVTLHTGHTLFVRAT